MKLQLLGWKAGQAQECTAQQDQSPLLNKELKVKLKCKGDRRQVLPVF